MENVELEEAPRRNGIRQKMVMYVHIYKYIDYIQFMELKLTALDFNFDFFFMYRLNSKLIFVCVLILCTRHSIIETR